MASLFDNILNSGSMPVLERVISFTEARHKVLVDNIANFDTIGYKVKDLPQEEFDKALSQAIKKQQSDPAETFEMNNTRHLEWDNQGKLNASPTEIENNNILFHDENNRFVEKQMSDMMKNAMLHNVAVELLNSQLRGLETAIRGRL